MQALFFVLALLAGSAAAQAPALPASELFSRQVLDPQGERLGRITDLLLDTHGGRIDYALLSTGEEGRRFPYPLTAFRPIDKEGEGRLELDVDRAALQGAAGIAASGGGPSGYRALRELLGREVVFADGSRAGDLQDFVIDMESGEVRYALVDFDPSLPDRWPRVGLDELTLPPAEGAIVLDARPR